MNVIGKVTVLPNLPAAISRLDELAYNLYWSWTPRAQSLYERLDPQSWERFQHNPVRTLLEVPLPVLEEAARDQNYLDDYQSVLRDFDAYMAGHDTWTQQHAQGLKSVGYFSMEYAFHECLPIYSGGLGVLAGDHCKSASDLGLPFQAVGLLFHQGYFSQLLNREGWQEETYEELDLTTLPIRPARTPAGDEAQFEMTISGRAVALKVWELTVGRIKVYLLDANLPQNSEADRGLTARLYGGNQDLRIQQYLILGVGGVRALRLLGLTPEVYHMNEGHAALLGLERVRELVGGGADFRTALEAVAASALFTTHTPVAAGNDAFGLDVMDRYLGEWPGLLHTSRDELYALARQDQNWGGQWVPTFSMTVLALNFSRAANGVSELHGEVSRRLWQFLFPGLEESEVPIGHVTNGAHTLTFLAQPLRELYGTVLPEDWTKRVQEKAMWQAIEQLPDLALADTQRDLKREMIQFVRARLGVQYARNGASAAELGRLDNVLSETALTIGFARRFATYKRATLLFRDRERLSRIVNDPQRPVQFVFAGKAHPADNPGKAFIQELYRMSRESEFAGKIVVLENYDMNVARHLVQGVDVWLNNPRRPLEASGTSGMKAGFNGGLNFSILDGWWREGFDGENGWAIGDEREYADLNVQDDADSFSLYQTLEQDIVPLYYRHNDAGHNHEWLAHVRRAIQTVTPEFSMQRQVIDYTQKYYLPLTARGEVVRADHLKLARSLGEWKGWVRGQWPHTSITAQSQLPSSVQPGQTVNVQAQVNTAGLKPEEVRVEAVLSCRGELLRTPLMDQGGGHYAAEIPMQHSGLYALGVRMFPISPEAGHEFEAGLAKWA